ncbi:MAG: late competence development ComFB family protein [Cyanobacteria bacterium]|nr:late competence development ComFB family protein [Cyanobacteriota bacterium]MDW8200857.1 late competence development ComFB family protein [Cyanobacteriota bacterium SKYGB_h_bin112]
MHTNTAFVYRNAMEHLVAEEIDKQFRMIPPRLARYLNKKEVAAFALNRLPSLYATSEKGWRQQCLRGRRDYSEQIATAVRQGVLAVQKDPLRIETPIAPDAADQGGSDAYKALQALRLLLHCDDLSWQNVVAKVEDAIAKSARGEIFGDHHHHDAQPHRRSAWNSAMYRY